MMLFNYLFVRSHGVYVMDVPKYYRKIIVFRALVGFFGIQGMWGSVKYMPVSTAGCIFFTMPMWTAFIAFVFLKEKLTYIDFLSLFMAFLGVLIINNPFGWGESGDSGNDDENNIFLGTVYALTGAIGGACALICMRVMRVGIHYSISPFWFASGCTFWSPFFHSVQLNNSYDADVTKTTVYDWQTIMLILGASVFSFFG